MSSYAEPPCFRACLKGLVAGIVLTLAFVWMYEGLPTPAPPEPWPERSVDVLVIFHWDRTDDYYGLLKKAQRFDYTGKPRTPAHYLYSPAEATSAGAKGRGRKTDGG